MVVGVIRFLFFESFEFVGGDIGLLNRFCSVLRVVVVVGTGYWGKRERGFKFRRDLLAEVFRVGVSSWLGGGVSL